MGRKINIIVLFIIENNYTTEPSKTSSSSPKGDEAEGPPDNML
jgi:hypothetical protein